MAEVATNPVSIPVPTPAVEEQVKTPLPLTINNIKLMFLSWAAKRKGKEKKDGTSKAFTLRIRPEIQLLDASEKDIPDPFTAFRSAVGLRNWNQTIARCLADIADDAAAESVKADGNVDAPTFVLKFLELFQPGSRRAGTGKAVIQQKIIDLDGRLRPFQDGMMKAAQQGVPYKWPTPGSEMEFGQLLSEKILLHQQLEKKGRVGLALAQAA